MKEQTYKKSRKCDVCKKQFLPWMCRICEARHYRTCPDCIWAEKA